MRKFEILEYLESRNVANPKNKSGIQVIIERDVLVGLIERDLIKVSMKDVLDLEIESFKKFFNRGFTHYDILIAYYSNKIRILYGLFDPKKHYEEIERFDIDDEEYKNYKRTKLINKILCQK